MQIGSDPPFNPSIWAFRTSQNHVIGRRLSVPVGSQYQTFAAEGTQAPDLPPGTLYGSFASFTLATSGAVVFNSFLEVGGSIVGNAIFSGTPGNIHLVARTGDAAAGMAPGVTYSLDPQHYRRINAAGEAAFSASLTGGGGVTAAIYRGFPGALNVVAQRLGPVLALGGDATFSTITQNSMSLNDAGVLAYHGAIAGTGITTANNSVLLSRQGVVETVVVQKGAPVTNGGTDVIYSGFSSPHLNNSGQIAFRATVQTGAGPTRAALIAGPLSAPAAIVQVGQHAPGTPPGMNFVDFSNVLFNDLGQLAFLARLTDAGGSVTNDWALYFHDPQYGTQLIAREGGLFDVGGGDMRTVKDISFSTDPAPIEGLNDRGELAMSLWFTHTVNNTSVDSSGVFVATVPEPGTVSLAMMLVYALSGRCIPKRR